MRSLDEFIKNNADAFDSDEPSEGHMERFGNRLIRSQDSSLRKSLVLVLRIAAVVVLGLAISYVAFHELNQMRRSSEGIFVSSGSPELIEAEKYYSEQMSIYYSKLASMQFNNDKKQKKQILDELTDMDRQVRTMKRDLKQNPDDERVVHAIMNYYQTKLDFMDMIINRTNQSSISIL